MKRFSARHLIRFLPILLPACPFIGSAQEPTGAPPLSLNEVLYRALANNFDVHIERFAVDNAGEQLEISRAEFDPTVRLSTNRLRSVEAAAVSSLDGAPGPERTVLNSQAGTNLLVPTGATIDLSTQLLRTKTNSSFQLLNPIYQSDATLRVTQPLLKGAGAKVTLASVRRSRLGIDRANLDYRARVFDVLRDTENAYYQLAFAREQLNVRLLGLKAAQQLYDENKARRDAGVLIDIDVLNAEVEVANQNIFVLNARQAVRDSEDALRALIGQFELDAALGEVSFGELPPLNLDSLQTFERAKLEQPEYRSELKLIEQLQIDVKTARNAILPQVDIGGSVGVNTDVASLSKAFNRLPDADSYVLQANLSVTLPWGSRADKARHRTAQNNLTRELIRIRQIEQNILVQARTSVRTVESNFETMRASRLAAELSANQYELEKARFNAGLSTSRRVLDSQRDLDQARLTELNNKVSLFQAIANLNRLEGRTLEVHGIELAGAGSESSTAANE